MERAGLSLLNQPLPACPVSNSRCLGNFAKGSKYFLKGLSPRGRGNRQHRQGGCTCSRSIPAWAGKPYPRAAVNRRATVYPRVGGETGVLRVISAVATGLSPRGRGNQRLADQRLDLRGSIPAWAGKPATYETAPKTTPVYPRVGGETSTIPSRSDIVTGLSPRGRGNHTRSSVARSGLGSIPAWAGKPTVAFRTRKCYMVYPRVGGETAGQAQDNVTVVGLSPRGRGNRGAACERARLRRSIPAWAGKPQRCCRFLPSTGVYPRVGGETPQQVVGCREVLGLSPRGRGNQLPNRVLSLSLRSIPAWAGKPSCHRVSSWSIRVYPRVGGETGDRRIAVQLPLGLSPRGRGNP